VGEIRLDDETGEWRLVAPERAGRPSDRWSASRPCPFCPGNEAMTPPEVLRVPAEGERWRVRVFPNRYPLARPAEAGPETSTAVPSAAGPTPSAAAPAEAAPSRPGPGLPASFPATGRHEVLVESPRHDWDLRHASVSEVSEILVTARARCRVLAGGNPAAVVVFRNHRPAAGTSLRHPHSQIIALDHAPPGLVRRWRRARDHYAHAGRPLHCDIAGRERTAGSRIVHDDGDLLVFQPYAPAVPYELCILPGDAAPDLAAAADATLASVAALLPRVLAALSAVLANPAYNLVVHGGPADVAGTAAWFQWHLRVQPRLTTPGGLELATGLTVTPASPEDTAPILRRALAARPALAR
jgi:UDPglucose--hexose-1-phosphate uridylyltransferase